MLKNVLTIAVLGVSALSVMAANAAAPGVYVTGQLGYANTHMAAKDKANDVPANFKLGNNGLAGRLAVGYQFNQNLAVELGYLQLSKGKANVPNITPYIPEKYSLKQSVADIAGKAILPLSNNFNVYGKLGLAYVSTSISSKYPGGELGPAFEKNKNDEFSIAKHKWAPEAAIGMSYDITSNVSVDTSWTHIQPFGNKRPGNIDFVAVGIGYNFG